MTMGFAYGKLLSKQVQATVEGILQIAAGSDAYLRGLSIGGLDIAYRKIERDIPPSRRGELKGIIRGYSRLAEEGRLKADSPAEGTLEAIYAATRDYIPAEYREEMRGLAEGAGIDPHKVELANLFPEMFHCSVFSLAEGAT